jgi:hypothetical protein
MSLLKINGVADKSVPILILPGSKDEENYKKDTFEVLISLSDFDYKTNILFNQNV